MNPKQVAKIGLYKLACDDRLTDWAQDMTDKVAEIIAEKYPELAEANPAAVGEIAKHLVKDTVSEVGKVATNE